MGRLLESINEYFVIEEYETDKKTIWEKGVNVRNDLG